MPRPPSASIPSRHASKAAWPASRTLQMDVLLQRHCLVTQRRLRNIFSGGSAVLQLVHAQRCALFSILSRHPGTVGVAGRSPLAFPSGMHPSSSSGFDHQ